MLRSLAVLARVWRSSTFLELVGASVIVAGVAGLAGAWWALIAAGVLLLLKAYDVALAENRS